MLTRVLRKSDINGGFTFVNIFVYFFSIVYFLLTGIFLHRKPPCPSIVRMLT